MNRLASFLKLVLVVFLHVFLVDTLPDDLNRLHALQCEAGDCVARCAVDLVGSAHDVLSCRSRPSKSGASSGPGWTCLWRERLGIQPLHIARDEAI